MSHAPFTRTAWLALLTWLFLGFKVAVAQQLPPPPDTFVSDRSGILQSATSAKLSLRLAQFERDSSSQIIVWIERKLPPDVALEEYVHAVFRSWKIGQARTNNGVLLAIFVDDRRLRIEVGRGLEGVLPDALAGRIIRNEIQPRFRNNDYDGGVRAGADAIMAAVRGEYQGTGSSVADRGESGKGVFIAFVFGLGILAFIFLIYRSQQRGGWRYSGNGSVGGGWGGVWVSGGGGGDRGGGGADSGGFSGGGGDSGGGGASGSW